ncbi:MAG TPA: GyrI-like domain-containing protein [Candidatus Dormibacteraeota bacterium]|nr:GyrI-like domain-containing protein [Candidatus Dormibacteraeota bacterium]
MPTLTVEVRDTKPQPYLGKRLRAPLTAVGSEVQAGFASLYARLTNIAVQPVGPPFLIADAPKDGYLDMELGAPCARPVQASDGFDGAMLPGGKVAVTVHRGAYDAIDKVYTALAEWMSSNGVSPNGPPREVYLSGPGEEPVTELVWPIR